MGHDISRTLAFFDLFDHPLTLYELYAWRVGGVWQSWSEFREMMDTLEHENHIRVIDGMVMLNDRVEILQIRRARQAGIARNMKRAIRAARLLRWVPFVEIVAVCNRLSVGHPHEDSDIDVFIVIRDGRLWFGRLLVTTMLQLAGLRRHGDRIANRVCLSFYITPRAAALDRIALAGHDDVYLRYWVVHLLPLWACKRTLDDFWQTNQWAHRAFHQAQQPLPLVGIHAPALSILFTWLLGGWAPRGVPDGPSWRRPRTSERRPRVGDALERVSRALQIRHMGASAARHDSAVVISNTMLKFHENDRRQWYAEQWKKRIHALGI